MRQFLIDLLTLPEWKAKQEKKNMELTDAVKAAADAEAALEARVAAHEEKDAQTIAALNQTVADLTAKLGAEDQAVKDLQDLIDKLNKVDA